MDFEKLEHLTVHLKMIVYYNMLKVRIQSVRKLLKKAYNTKLGLEKGCQIKFNGISPEDS